MTASKLILALFFIVGAPLYGAYLGRPSSPKQSFQQNPKAPLVLDWWHIAMRFEYALQAARGLGAGTTSAYPHVYPIRDLEGAKWKLWHGRSSSRLGRSAELANWFDYIHVRDVRGAVAARRHIRDLIEYLPVNCHVLVHGAGMTGLRRERGQRDPKHMIKKQQMRWNRWTLQPFLAGPIAVLNKTLCSSFRRGFPAFPRHSQRDDPTILRALYNRSARASTLTRAARSADR
jgi:hypothetical protein